MAQKINYLTPVGTAVYPHLQEPHSFAPGEKPTYQLKLAFPPQVLAKVKKDIRDLADKAGFPKNIKLPFRTDKDGQETMFAKSQYKPGQFDASNQPIDVNVGGGSQLRASVNLNYYKTMGGGISLYLQAVQVVELQEGRNGQSPFDETEGFRFEADEPIISPTETGHVESAASEF